MLLPPGIRNEENICFASSILQCLLNQQLFRKVFIDVGASHASACKECKQGFYQYLVLFLCKK
jgi:ubiquitin C-terminal hydrolase